MHCMIVAQEEAQQIENHVKEQSKTLSLTTKQEEEPRLPPAQPVHHTLVF